MTAHADIASSNPHVLLKTLHIRNFKSIRDLTIDIGRFNVFVGENGCGKSNILEAIAFGAAASRTSLRNDYLAARGIRIADPSLMRSAFGTESKSSDIFIDWTDQKEDSFGCQLREGLPGSFKWRNITFENNVQAISQFLSSLPDSEQKQLQQLLSTADLEATKKVFGSVGIETRTISSQDFLIYAPENSSLRNFQAEGQILPLGIKGEGLFAHLQLLNTTPEHFQEIGRRLNLFDWFSGFRIPTSLTPNERAIQVQDRFLTDGTIYDQRSTNEGFLFLLFYFTLFISPYTPQFFAIDNVDTSLNPKMCEHVIQHLYELSKTSDKQVILTTHNPAILDGLDLHDDDQRLFVVSRGHSGDTKIRRIQPPRAVNGALPMKLSTAFTNGLIGGLPKNF